MASDDPQKTRETPENLEKSGASIDPVEVLSEEEAGEQETARPRFSLEVVGENVSEAMAQLKNQVQYWADRGRYNKVRIKRAGKPVLPDIPVGALMALEAATFFLERSFAGGGGERCGARALRGRVDQRGRGALQTRSRAFSGG